MSEEKRLHGRSWCRQEDNIRMDPMKIGWQSEDGLHLAKYRDKRWTLGYTVMKF
jgi:hypothetical protein